MRQELEARAHCGVGCFVTLTFAWHSLPESELAARAVVHDFLRRLRSWIADTGTPSDFARLRESPAISAGLKPGSFRFLAAIERGSRGTRRLHVHLNLFGLSPSMRFGGATVRRLIEKAWQGRGFSKIKRFRDGCARYVAKYLVKAGGRPMYSKGGHAGLGGLGALVVPCLAAEHDASARDVERRVSVAGGRFLFLDGYLADRLRRAVGFDAVRLAELRRERHGAAVQRFRSYVERRWREFWRDLGPLGPAPDPFRGLSLAMLNVVRVEAMSVWHGV